MSIVMWNGNEDEEVLKESTEKGEIIEGIRGNGKRKYTRFLRLVKVV